MTMTLLDNDILIKGAAYGLLRELIQAIPTDLHDAGVLGASRYVVPNALTKAKLNKNANEAISHFKSLEEKFSYVEPTEEESQLAAELETFSQQNNLFLDAGESQLLSILFIRTLNQLVTGDKRAIYSMEIAATALLDVERLKGKISCLEQVFIRLVAILKEKVRDCVCQEPDVDKAISICFSCHQKSAEIQNCLDGLQSYINDAKKKSAQLLSG